jgi:hypothetical protein
MTDIGAKQNSTRYLLNFRKALIRAKQNSTRYLLNFRKALIPALRMISIRTAQIDRRLPFTTAYADGWSVGKRTFRIKSSAGPLGPDHPSPLVFAHP